MNVKVTLTAMVLCLASQTAVYAQEWPNKPIKMIAPQPPGGGPERVIRAISQGLSQRLGQNVVVDYKPGANGNIGAGETVRSAPDGYTWMLSAEHVATINPSVYKSLGYNKNDLIPVNLIASLNQVLACHPKVGANTIADLVRIAKTKTLTYASAGAGSNGHLTMEMFLAEQGIQMTHVPYRGPAPAAQDLVAGQIDCSFNVTASLVENLKAKQIVGIATTSLTRIPSLPDVPTMKEVGMPNFDGNFWLAMFTSKDVPKAVVEKFNKALDETIRSQPVVDAMAANNTFLVGSNPEVAQAEIAKAARKWGDVAKRLNLAIE